MWPKVSILIAARDEEKVIGRLLSSLQKVRYPKNLLEILVIVDGSKDKTAKIARSFKGVKVLEQKEPRKCKGEALNAALPLTTGEIIAVFDADAIVSPNAIKAAVRNFKKADVAAVIGPHYSYNCKSWVSKACAIEMSIYNFVRELRAKFRRDVHIDGGNFYIRKEILEELGGFDTETLLEDSELAFRLKLAKPQLKAIYEPNAIAYLQEPSTLSAFIGQRQRWARGAIRLFKKYQGMRKQSLWLATQGIHYYAAPFATALSLSWLFLPFLSSLRILEILIPINIIVMIYAIFAAAALVKYKKASFIPYIPFWLNLSTLELFIFCKAAFDEFLNKEFTWFKTPRE